MSVRVEEWSVIRTVSIFFVKYRILCLYTYRGRVQHLQCYICNPNPNPNPKSHVWTTMSVTPICAVIYLLTVEEDNPCPLGPPFFSKKSLRSDWSRMIGSEGLNGCSRP